MLPSLPKTVFNVWLDWAAVEAMDGVSSSTSHQSSSASAMKVAGRSAGRRPVQPLLLTYFLSLLPTSIPRTSPVLAVVGSYDPKFSPTDNEMALYASMSYIQFLVRRRWQQAHTWLQKARNYVPESNISTYWCGDALKRNTATT
jgi:hypothetical protein